MSLPAGATAPTAPITLNALTAVAERQRSPSRHKRPVALIGPGEADPAECAAAYRIARALAQAGIAIVCGGRGGVMEAAAHGAQDGGGIVIGILPEEDTRAANHFLTVALPTGIGEMRNALIARSASCLIAVGGGLGTISEAALGLKWQKPVFGILGAPTLPGAIIFDREDELISAVARWLLDAEQ